MVQLRDDGDIFMHAINAKNTFAFNKTTYRNNESLPGQNV